MAFDASNASGTSETCAGWTPGQSADRSAIETDSSCRRFSLGIVRSGIVSATSCDLRLGLSLIFGREHPVAVESRRVEAHDVDAAQIGFHTLQDLFRGRRAVVAEAEASSGVLRERRQRRGDDGAWINGRLQVRHVRSQAVGLDGVNGNSRIGWPCPRSTRERSPRARQSRSSPWASAGSPSRRSLAPAAAGALRTSAARPAPSPGRARSPDRLHWLREEPEAPLLRGRPGARRQAPRVDGRFGVLEEPADVARPARIRAGQELHLVAIRSHSRDHGSGIAIVLSWPSSPSASTKNRTCFERRSARRVSSPSGSGQKPSSSNCSAGISLSSRSTVISRLVR